MTDKAGIDGKSSRTRLAGGVRPRYEEPADINDDSEESQNRVDLVEHNGAVMRVGKDYQAKIPECNPEMYDGKHEARLVWQPNSAKLSNSQAAEFCKIAKQQHKYTEEQALGMLFWHKHDIDKALADLANFAPFPDEWTMEDKVLFEQAFAYHGKGFHRIREMLPDKSIAALVKFYYSWKKTSSRRSVIDRQAKEAPSNDISSDISDLSDSEDSVSAEKTEKDGQCCSNCSSSCQQLHLTNKGSLCNACYQYWRRTGLMRPFAPTRNSSKDLMPQRYNPTKNRRRPPKGIYMNEADLLLLASGGSEQSEAIIGSIQTELSGLRSQVQFNKQQLGQLKTNICIDQYRLEPSVSQPRSTNRWSQDELLLAVQGVRRYGKDFEAIAQVIRTKTETHVRSFFTAYKRRYNLDQVLADYHAEHGHTPHDQALEMVSEYMNDAHYKQLPIAPSRLVQCLIPAALIPVQYDDILDLPSNVWRLA